MRDENILVSGITRSSLTMRSQHVGDAAVERVRDAGYVVVEDVKGQRDADAVLAAFGRVMPQYDGSPAYEVRAEPGFEGRAYSKSRNEIRAHTEAPGWQPPPGHLALWCHVQAQGGGGETCLADLKEYTRNLGPGIAAKLRSHEIRWGGGNTSGTGSAGATAPVLARTESGGEILRFSYNLLTSGHYDPPLDREVPEAELPWGRFGREFAEQVHGYFQESAVRIRIPENALLIWDNQRMAHSRLPFTDGRRHLTRYWLAADGR